MNPSTSGTRLLSNPVCTSFVTFGSTKQPKFPESNSARKGSSSVDVGVGDETSREVIWKKTSAVGVEEDDGSLREDRQMLFSYPVIWSTHWYSSSSVLPSPNLAPSLSIPTATRSPFFNTLSFTLK
jgi:hypothetical protein